MYPFKRKGDLWLPNKKPNYNRIFDFRPDHPHRIGLVGQWMMVEGGGNTLFDISKLGNAGTIYGATWIDVKTNSALNFDGINDYGKINRSNSIYILGDVSLEILVKFDSFGDEEIIGAYGPNHNVNSDSNIWYLLSAITGGDIKIGHEYGTGTNQFETYDTNLSAGVWYHLVATRDDSAKKWKLYIDGEKIGSDYSYSDSASGGEVSDLYFGAFPEYSHWTDCNISYIRIYNITQPAAMIKSLYEKPFAAWEPQKKYWVVVEGGDSSSSGGPITVQGACTDGIKFGDTPSKRAILRTTILDGLNFNDSPGNRADLLVSIQDGTSFGDTIQNIATFLVRAQDGIKMGDNVSIIADLLASVLDGIKLGDTIQSRADLLAAISDGIKFGDTSSNRADLLATISDGIIFSDSVIATISGLLGLCSDGITFSDTATIRADLKGSITDGIKLGAAISATMSLLASASDGIILSDQPTISLIAQALAQDGIIVSDTVTKFLIKLVQLSDGIILSDSGSIRANYIVICSDGIQFTDTIRAIMTLYALVTDGLKMGDTPSGVNITTTASGEVTISFSIPSGPMISFTVKQGPGISFN